MDKVDTNYCHKTVKYLEAFFNAVLLRTTPQQRNVLFTGIVKMTKLRLTSGLNVTLWQNSFIHIYMNNIYMPKFSMTNFLNFLPYPQISFYHLNFFFFVSPKKVQSYKVCFNFLSFIVFFSILLL